jgi:hypothetical protein
MARLKLVLALLLTTARSALSLQYQLIQEYNSTNFFEEFSFFAVSVLSYHLIALY